jgi:peroxiredoxin
VLAAVFTVAGLAKLVDHAGSRQALIAFGVPAILATPLGVLLPLAELAVGLAMLPARSAYGAALAALALLGAFLIGITINLAYRRRPTCHCFGQLSAHPIGGATLVRTALLAAVAAWFLVWGRSNRGYRLGDVLSGLSVVHSFGLIGGLLVVALLVFEGWLLLHLLRQHGRLLLRIEALEHRLTTSAVREPPGPSAPAPGLLVGRRAPPLKLPDLNGTLVDLASFRGTDTVLLFWNPACGFCTQMLDALKAMERNRPNAAPALVVVSSGTVDATRTLDLQAPILLDEHFAAGRALGARGTPSAVLVDAGGNVATNVVVGAPDVLALCTHGAQRQHLAVKPAVRRPGVR